jgi:hypothetical protein
VPKRDPHQVLGVERGAGMAAIKAAWRRLARAHHPDLTATDPAAVRKATARMAEINAAYDHLRLELAERDAGFRYDEVGGRGRAGAPRGPEPGPKPPPRPAGPPPPRPTRPVTARVDTSATFRPRNTTMGPGIRLDPAGAPPRARPADPGPPRASPPNGPVRRHRAISWTPPPQPSLAEARDLELHFGKFHGHTLGEVADFEPSYVDWLAVTPGHDPDLVAAARVVRRRLDELGIRRRTRESRRPPPLPE